MSRRGSLVVGWVLAVLVIALFTRLGFWQLARMHEKQALLAASHAVVRDRIAHPLALAANDARATGYDWAAGRGHFIPGPAVLLDNQARDDRTGVRAYRVFQPDARGAPPLLVELGWLPVPGDRTMPKIAAIPGTLRIDGLLSPPPSGGLARAIVTPQADGSLLTITLDLSLLRRALQLPTLAPRVLKLDPAQPIGYARDLDILPNTLPPQRHLGYAVQWFGLALAVLVTALVLTFRTPRQRRPHATP
ncbi:SURF1 family protein [Cognatiluteimonas telluris]|uniref:SURF1 family protein n=1 Tax=Cognatiluteimonas telluris TaxID=1104775 RepID=UPI001407A502|nr:SURF1 family protein [Lysobacter telluris]